METEPFGDTFGPKAQRKKPRLDVGSFEELGKSSAAALDEEETAETALGDSTSTSFNLCHPVQLAYLLCQILLRKRILCLRRMQTTLSLSTSKAHPVEYTENCTKSLILQTLFCMCSTPGIHSALCVKVS